MSREEQFDFYWKEIFDGLAYNPIEFNTYRFDQSMSLPSKFNKLYEMFKQLALNNQEVMDYLKEFVETFDVKLYETIEDVLEVLLEDGRLAEVVRVAISEEVIEARTDYLGKNYVDLKERLDDEKKEVTTQLAEVTTQLAQTKVNVVNLDYFAHADGVIPDDDNLMLAIEELHAMGGGILYAPSTYFIENSVTIPYDNIFIKGIGKGKTIFNLASNGKIRFQILHEAVPTNPNAFAYNNLPPYKNLDYFNVHEFGGSDNRLSNVGLSDITFNKVEDGGSTHSLHFYKVDGIHYSNIEVTFDNPQQSLGAVQDNPITHYFCSDIEFENVDIEDNYRISFGMFLYWSYGITFKNVNIGNVGSKGLEIKHAVNVEGSNINVVQTSKGRMGISVNYGSQDVHLENIYLVKCSLNLASSVEFEYSKNLNVKRVKIYDDTYSLSNVDGFGIEDVELHLSNRYSEIYGMLVTAQPLYHTFTQSVNDYVQNTDFFEYDGEYDTSQELTHGGVTHYRLMTLLQQPTIVNGKVNNVKIYIKKEGGGQSRTNFHMIFVQGGGTQSDNSLTDNGRIKMLNGHYPLSMKDVEFENIKIICTGDDNAQKEVVNNYLSARAWVLNNVTFKNIKSEVKGSISGIKDGSLFALLKLDNVLFDNVELLKNNQYGLNLSNVSAYNNVTFKKININISGFSSLRFMNITPDYISGGNALVDEDYLNIKFEDCSLKGFICFMWFDRTLVDLNSKTNLKNSRFISNNLTNSSFDYVKHNSGGELTKSVLTKLNTLNDVEIV